ncbi:MAG: hypothetical protein V1901_01420 [Patescibacteria group bacterium]
MLKNKEKNLEKVLELQSKTILKAVDFGFKNIKKDIKGMKGDMGGMKRDIGGIKGEIVGIKYEIGAIKNDVKDLKQDTRKILNQQDRFVKRLDDLDQEDKMSTEIYKKHDKKIENHEERILAIEAKS